MQTDDQYVAKKVRNNNKKSGMHPIDQYVAKKALNKNKKSGMQTDDEYVAKKARNKNKKSGMQTDDQCVAKKARNKNKKSRMQTDDQHVAKKALQPDELQSIASVIGTKAFRDAMQVSQKNQLQAAMFHEQSKRRAKRPYRKTRPSVMLTPDEIEVCVCH